MERGKMEKVRERMGKEERRVRVLQNLLFWIYSPTIFLVKSSNLF